MAHITLTKDNFAKEVLHSEKPVLVDFWASWCGPCMALAPTVDEVAEEQSAVAVGKVNVDDEPELARQYRIMSIPTLMLFQNGEPVRREVGGKSKSELLEMMGLDPAKV
ncbi:MAG: thioredoxin [Oscillospiraceae bacterium]|nr:thioredoxin [Oscillospiraceae bacterium]